MRGSSQHCSAVSCRDLVGRSKFSHIHHVSGVFFVLVTRGQTNSAPSAKRVGAGVAPMRCKRFAWRRRTLLACREPPRSNLRLLACMNTDSLRLIIRIPPVAVDCVTCRATCAKQFLARKYLYRRDEDLRQYTNIAKIIVEVYANI